MKKHVIGSKKIIIAAILVLSFSFSGCEKEKSTQTKRTATDHFKMMVSHDNIVDIYSGYDIDFDLKWKRISNGVLEQMNTVFFDFNEFDSAHYNYNSDSTITVINSCDTFNIEKLAYWRSTKGIDYLAFSVSKKNNALINITISTDLYDLNYEYLFNSKAACHPALIWAAACIIAGAVDYYCDAKIKKGADGCTAQGKCTKIGTCQVECVECKKQ